MNKLLKFGFFSIIGLGVLVIVSIFFLYGGVLLEVSKDINREMQFNSLPCSAFLDVNSTDAILAENKAQIRAGDWAQVEPLDRCPGKAYLNIYASSPPNYEKFGLTFYSVPFKLTNT